MTRATTDEMTWRTVERRCGHETRHLLPEDDEQRRRRYAGTLRILRSTDCEACQGETYRRRIEGE